MSGPAVTGDQGLSRRPRPQVHAARHGRCAPSASLDGVDDDPTVPSPEQQWPADGAPSVAEDQAVLGWLAALCPRAPLTSDLLLDPLNVWDGLAPVPELAAEPKARADCDRAQVLGQITDRLVRRLLDAHADEHAQVVLWDVTQRLGLVWRSLDDPERAARERAGLEPTPGWLLALQVAERDAAVDAALAAVVRERNER
jgi:hypothetical protein